MVKLYYTSTSCGAANFITAFLSGINIEAEQVDLPTHKTASGVDFYTVNPKGNVPTLVLDDGKILNENAATLQYIADLDSTHKLLPAAGEVSRYEVLNALSYVGSEYHKSVGNLFNPTISAEVKAFFLEQIAAKLTHLNTALLKDKTYLVGEQLSIADVYLYICLSWSGYLGLDLSPYPNVQSFFQRVGDLEGIKGAHAAMATSPTNTAA
jgi:glutathione S-transferase